MKHTYVLPLADHRTSLETVGGKGASLARLVNAGLPVPDGFHVTTAAYQEFVTANVLQPFILETVRMLISPSLLRSRPLHERSKNGLPKVKCRRILPRL
jgi:phosphoenolpyruvate synthase/pyruvate phosphate dikinase